PLFAVGGRVVGKSFFVKTLIATLAMSFYIDIVPTPVLSTDMILASVYGGTLVGIGLGLTIYAGATTGGTDMAAKILHAQVPKISVATFLFIIDVAVVLAAALVFNAAVALYAIASIYISSKLIDVVVAGFKTGQAYFIITTKPEEIRKGIIEDMDRGVTLLDGVGGFTGDPKSVLLCVIRRKSEVIDLKRLVAKADEKAFMIATNVTEVLGEGFTD
ncbi:MAG: YitT family protein, partial [Eubacteriales bacterium]